MSNYKQRYAYEYIDKSKFPRHGKTYVKVIIFQCSSIKHRSLEVLAFRLSLFFKKKFRQILHMLVIEIMNTFHGF